MAIIALISSRKSFGRSTAALAMTLLWPRAALLAECDPAGGSSVLSGYLRGTVDHTQGLLPLAMALRQEELDQVLWNQTVALTPAAESPSSPTDDRRVLPGLSDAAQAPSVRALWGPLGSMLASLERAGTDVIVNAGRLGTAQDPNAPTPLLRQADLVLLVMGTGLPEVGFAKARLNLLREELSLTGDGSSSGRLGGAPPANLGLLLVGEGRPYTAKEISGAFGVPVVASLAWDPGAAEVLATGATPGRRFNTSPLVRSTQAAISASSEIIRQRRDRLAPPTAAPASPSIADRLLGREAANDA